MKHAVRSIIRRKRGTTIALPLRPIAMRLISGFLRDEPLEETLRHLQTTVPLETIDLLDEDVRRILA